MEGQMGDKKMKVYFNSAIDADKYVKIKMEAARLGVTIKSYIADVVSRHADALDYYDVEARQQKARLDCDNS